jgi:hypothetical protein
MAAVLLVAAAGCGALFNGGPAKVQFTSAPDGADVWINGAPQGKTPVILDLAKNRNHNIVFKKDGYTDYGVTINRKVSVGLVILDVLGGVFPVVIDAAAGSWYTLDNNMVVAKLDQKMVGQLTSEQLNLIKLGVPLDKVLAD